MYSIVIKTEIWTAYRVDVEKHQDSSVQIFSQAVPLACLCNYNSTQWDLIVNVINKCK